MRSRPYHSVPFHDELLSSWLVRLSLGNGCKPHTLCSLFFANTEVWTRDIDRSAPTSLFSKLALISREFNDIDFEQHTLQHFNRCFDGGISKKATNVGILPIGVYHRLRKYGGLQYCPHCLKNDKSPYYRRHWRLSVHFMCEQHQCLLRNCCSVCLKPLMPHRHCVEDDVTLGICSYCHHDLRDEATEEADPTEQSVQYQLSNMITLGYIDIGSTHIDCILFLQGYFQLTKLVLRWSKQSDIRRYLERSLNIDLSIVSNYSLNIRHNEYIVCPSVRARLATTVFALLEQWPQRFVNVMTDLRILSSVLRKSRKSLPFWIDSIIADNLYRPNTVKNKRPSRIKSV